MWPICREEAPSSYNRMEHLKKAPKTKAACSVEKMGCKIAAKFLGKVSEGDHRKAQDIARSAMCLLWH
jgi:hypothetical protein